MRSGGYQTEPRRNASCDSRRSSSRAAARGVERRVHPPSRTQYPPHDLWLSLCLQGDKGDHILADGRIPHRRGLITTDNDVLHPKARRYDTMMRKGRIRSTAKHPEGEVPAAEDFNAYAEESDALEFPYWEEDVAVIASRLKGAVGPSGLKGAAGLSGISSEMLESWLLQYGLHSTCLWVEMAEWVVMLANEAPGYAMYCVLNARRMLAADKEPGYPMLWNVFFLWQKGSRFSFNRYRHRNIVIMHDEWGRAALLLLNKEGSPGMLLWHVPL
ncbi:hypothetical protein ACHAWF_014045 [Thalassiosira exigua]